MTPPLVGLTLEIGKDHGHGQHLPLRLEARALIPKMADIDVEEALPAPPFERGDLCRALTSSIPCRAASTLRRRQDGGGSLLEQ